MGTTVREQPLASLILDCPLEDFVGRFRDDDSGVRGQSNKRIWSVFDVLDQVGVEDKGLAIESRESNHVGLLCGM